MYLKRLDSLGFKAFAERTTVDFVPGITAVVGPNGSGKSNITDAIRWVLGETSARTLRGTKMEDIIFSGSQSRKPLNFAEVTLTLDNADSYLPSEYSEVSVTRRVYRSGESEFLINKQPVRLKDITDLFMDTGLGKEAFSIIGQGKVEEIISSKPEDRRTIFEEAAGVLKYKKRKVAAEKKLDETQVNLNRVNDIIHELSGQIEPLRIQSILARDYLEKKAELEQYEVAYLAHEIENLHEKWETLTKLIKEHTEQEVSLAATITTKEVSLDGLRNDRMVLDEKISALQDQFATITEEFERLEGIKAVNEEKKKNATQNVDKIKSEIELNKLEITNFTAQYEEATVKLEQIKTEIAEIQEKLNLENELANDGSEFQSRIDGLQAELIELLNAQAKIKHELEMLSSQKASRDYKSQKWLDEKIKLDTERDQNEVLINEYVAKLEIIKAELEKTVSAYQSEVHQLNEAKLHYQQKNEKLNQTAQDLQRLISRKEALEALEDDYQGFFQGVREVLKEKNKSLRGIEGAIAELIQVPKKYNMAIEIALGGALQNIIVSDEAAGRNAIDFLRRNKMGRATFMPLSVMKGRMVANNVVDIAKKNSAFIGVASDLIQFEQKYAEVIQNLLGNVLLANDLKAANEIAKATEYRYRVVTLDGDLVNPGGAMTGGASKQTSSLLSRKSELEEIAPRIVSMTAESERLRSELQELSIAISKADTKQNEYREASSALRVEESNLNGDLSGLRLTEKNISDRYKIFEADFGAFKEEKEFSEGRVTELSDKLTKTATEIAKLEQALSTLQSQKNEAQRNKDSVTETINEYNIVIARKTEQLNFQNQEMARYLFETDKCEERIKSLELELSLLAPSINEESPEMIELIRLSMEKAEEKASALAVLQEQRGIRTELHMKEEDDDRELKELQRQHRGLTNTLHDEEVKKTRAEVEMENRLTKLSEEYHLTFEAAKEKYPLTVDPAEARKKVKLINIALEELGVVNIGAIDEYERVSERYNFLETQKSDLEEARQTLLDVIAEMDEEMVKRFNESFTQIQVYFKEVFPKLFGGGFAELKLTNPEDLLNTGIDIVAQPPGKKLQHLSLLSGGERALTAIALLFAILKVRPVPFCVLDEVEAALDDVNVHRFVTYLKEFSKESQFIVITHRKGTMEGADVLYGVTMQESGVSKLVSVRLEESRELVAVN
ncbi:MAG: smc [Bacillales bacterium]|jgi:chromosome segregation protein|nr:smc [Bacillales bacterium]